MDKNLKVWPNMTGTTEFPTRGLLEFTHFGYMWMALNTKKIVASHTVYHLLGLEPFSEFLTEEKWHRHVHPQDLQLLSNAERQLLFTGQPVSVEYRLLTKSGNQININHSMQLSTGPNAEVKIVSILDDITESKRADTILDVMNESFFELTQSFLFRRINAKAETFWNVNRDEVLSENIWKVLPQCVNTPFYDEILTAANNKTDSTRELICPITGRWIRLSISPYTDGLIVIFYDIHEQKQAEEQNRELNVELTLKNRHLASLNSELKTFSSIIANNYLETLGHVYINLELIATNEARLLSNSGKANLRRAQAAIQKLKLTTDDLVRFSRLQQIDVTPQKVDLNAILEDVKMNFFNEQVNTPVDIRCNPLPVVEGYPFLISLLFHHLLDNAIKFRRDDANHSIIITCREFVTSLESRQPQAIHNNYHVISFIDNGIGFPLEESEKIFEIFYRLHGKGSYRGSGVGLAVCKKVMEMHGGFIIASGTEQGSSFECYFPCNPIET